MILQLFALTEITRLPGELSVAAVIDAVLLMGFPPAPEFLNHCSGTPSVDVPVRNATLAALKITSFLLVVVKVQVSLEEVSVVLCIWPFMAWGGH